MYKIYSKNIYIGLYIKTGNKNICVMKDDMSLHCLDIKAVLKRVRYVMLMT